MGRKGRGEEVEEIQRSIKQLIEAKNNVARKYERCKEELEREEGELEKATQRRENTGIIQKRIEKVEAIMEMIDEVSQQRKECKEMIEELRKALEWKEKEW